MNKEFNGEHPKKQRGAEHCGEFFLLFLSVLENNSGWKLPNANTIPLGCIVSGWQQKSLHQINQTVARQQGGRGDLDELNI